MSNKHVLRRTLGEIKTWSELTRIVSQSSIVLLKPK